MDPVDIQYHILEFEYKDYLSRREVTHYAEWGLPLGFFTALIASGRIQDIGSFVLVGFVALLLYLVINGKRQNQDRNLEAIRLLLSDLGRYEPLPRRLIQYPPPQPRPLKPHERFTVFLVFTFLAALFYFSAKTVNLTNFVGYTIFVVLIGAWTILRLTKPIQAPQENTT